MHSGYVIPWILPAVVRTVIDSGASGALREGRPVVWAGPNGDAAVVLDELTLLLVDGE